MTGWTRDRVERLKLMVADGLSARQIAMQLGGVSRNAVLGKLHRMNDGERPRPGRVEEIAPKPKRGRPSYKVLAEIKPPVPLPKRTVAPVKAPLVANDRWGCQYITAETDLGNAPKCASPRVYIDGKASPYCAAHHALCFNPPPVREYRRRGEARLQSARFW